MTSDQNLWQFFAQREEQIVRKREELKAELEALRMARALVEGAKDATGRDAARDKLTIKDMIRQVLEKTPEGGTSDQIIQWINLTHGTEIARTSLSPQLSRLKADNEVSLDEGTGIWSLSKTPTRRTLMPPPHPPLHTSRASAQEPSYQVKTRERR